MTVFFQNEEDEDVLYRTESPLLPNVGESVRIFGEWYDVAERTFYCDREQCSCTVWVRKG